MKTAFLTVIIAALLAPGTPLADMEIAPIVVEIDAHAPSAVVTVRNSGKTPMRYQALAFVWSESAGETRLEPARDLAVFPPVFQLGPGKEQKLRVGATVPPSEVERTWRLFVEELPAPDTSGKMTVRFRTRFAFPVFQAPVHARPSGTALLGASGGKLSALVKNTGNMHLRPEAMTVKLRGADGKPVGDVDVPPVNVLAGTEKSFDVRVPRELCAGVRSATLTVVLPSGTLEAALALPAGACVP